MKLQLPWFTLIRSHSAQKQQHFRFIQYKLGPNSPHLGLHHYQTHSTKKQALKLNAVTPQNTISSDMKTHQCLKPCNVSCKVSVSLERVKTKSQPVGMGNANPNKSVGNRK